MPSPIRIRIAESEPFSQGEREDVRTTFWRGLRSSAKFDGRSVEQLEGQLRREFGGTLAGHLVGGIRHELSTMDQAARGEEPPWYIFDFPMQRKEPYWEEAVAAFSKYLEFRQQLISDVPEYSNAIRRLSDASRVLFSVKIREYKSLGLDLDISPIEKVAAAFESDFDSFRVFLDVFVPKTIGSIFTQEFADSFSYNIDIPQDFKNAFAALPSSAPSPKAVISPATVPPQSPVPSTSPESQKRAEWLWRLANGSLVVPVVLALIVLYFGWKEMSDLRGVQQKALESVLDHQQKLLEEDRQRLEKLLQPPTTSASTLQTQGTVPTKGTAAPATP